MVDKLLTNKKKEWVGQFKPSAVMRGKPLHSPFLTERKYQRALEKLIKQMVAETEKELKALYKREATEAHFAKDENVGAQAKMLMNGLQKKFDQLFNRRSKGLVKSLLKETQKASKSSLHGSLKELSGGLSIKTGILTNELSAILIASAAENAALIKSIPQKYLGQVQGSVMRSIATGNGLQDLVPALKKYKMITHRRARMIAHDQTRKVYGSINKERLTAIGVKKFEWVHSGGGEVPRKHHIDRWPKGLNRGIFRFDDLPIIDEKTGEKGIPSQLPNCRCTMRPVIEFDEGDAED